MNILQPQHDMISILNSKINASQSNLYLLKTIIQDLGLTYSTFANSINQIAQKFHSLSADDEEQPDKILGINQILSNYLLNIGDQVKKFVQSFNNDLIEPLELFNQQFRQTNSSIQIKSKQIFQAQENFRKSVHHAQENYFKLSKESEKSLIKIGKALQQVDKGQKQQDLLLEESEKSIQMKIQSEEAFLTYKRVIEASNKNLDSFELNFKSIFENADLNEESRIRYQKTIAKNLVQLIQNLNSEFINLDKSTLQKIFDLDIKIDKEKLSLYDKIYKKVEKIAGKEFIIKREEIVLYEIKQSFNKDQTAESPGKKDGNDFQVLVINKYIDNLINNKSKTYSNDLIQFLQTFKTPEVSNSNTLLTVMMKPQSRTFFLDQFYFKLTGQKHKFFFELTEQFFNDLQIIFKEFLNQIESSENQKPDELQKLLIISQKVYWLKSQNNSKKYMINYLSQHKLWQNRETWKKLFEYMKEQKFNEKNIGKNKKVSLFGKGLQLVKNAMTELTEDDNQNTENEIILSLMEEVNMFLIDLSLQPEIQGSILLDIALNYKNSINQEQLTIMLSKQQSKNNSNIRKKNYFKKSLSQGSQIARIIQILKLSIPYLSLVDKPEQLLLVSKEFKISLQKSINKYYLLGNWLYNNQTKQKRLHDIQIDYQQLAVSSPLGQQIDEIISLDVQRSLHIHKEKISHPTLLRLLRTYATHNKVQYCQGMNYIVGYIYITLQNEELTYRLFDILMSKNFSILFLEEFNQLKMCFYQFERLLSIYLPELSQHLKNEKINASYFAPSWFITMFSCVFQYCKDSALLNIFWDIFFIQGWKGFYKCCLFLLSIFESKLFEMEFDVLLHYLSDLVKNEIFFIEDESELRTFINQQAGDNFLNMSIKNKILSIKVRKNLLSHLEEEYFGLLGNLNEQVKILKK